jgi:tetratricopeptide (TPR) repeat protein
MHLKRRIRFYSLLSLFLFLVCSTPLFPQGSVAGGTANDLANGKDKSPTNYENTMNMAPPRESNAFKTFEAIPDSQFEKKTKSGEEFIRKFSNSSLLPAVYSILTVTYIENGQPEKGFVDGEKALALRPNDTRTLANLAQAMARLNNPSDPDSAQKLQKAEQYAQKCIQLTPTLQKPESVSDQDFTAVNNQNLALAHSALGTIDIRRGKYAEAIPDLQEAIRLDNGKDPTNLYLLGIANRNSGHYPEAAAAFTKCAATAGTAANLQSTCREAATEAQQHATSKP